MGREPFNPVIDPNKLKGTPFEKPAAPDETETAERTETEPGKKYQLLYDPAISNEDCFMVKEWTQEQLDDWENSGYRANDGHYTEVAVYNSEEELEAAKRSIEFDRAKDLAGKELEGYEGLEANGYTTVNEEGAKNGIGQKGDKWMSFIYYDRNSSTGQEEPFYGAVNPKNGQVIATGSEIQHWFD